MEVVVLQLVFVCPLFVSGSIYLSFSMALSCLSVCLIVFVFFFCISLFFLSVLFLRWLQITSNDYNQNIIVPFLRISCHKCNNTLPPYWKDTCLTQALPFMLKHPGPCTKEICFKRKYFVLKARKMF